MKNKPIIPWMQSRVQPSSYNREIEKWCSPVLRDGRIVGEWKSKPITFEIPAIPQFESIDDAIDVLGIDNVLRYLERM